MKKKTLLIFILFFVISLLAEIFLFNCKHWISLRGEEITQDTLILGASYSDNGDGTYTIIDGGDASVYISDLNRELVSSCIEVKVLNGAGDEDMVKVWQYVTDDSSRYEYELPPREVWASVPQSSYMIYHLYGNCTGIRILPNIKPGTIVSLNIKLNPEIPVFFSVLRMGILFALMCFLYVFRPHSAIYKISFVSVAPIKRFMLIVLLFVVHAGIFWFLSDLNPDFTWGIPEHHKQYQKLAEAFKEGSFSLLEAPAQSLQNMDNPYDYAYRDDVVAANGETYLWDTAYYDGKYYVYFGVVPVLLFYLPYYLVTGSHISNYMVIFITSLLFLGGLLGTLHETAKKWFPKLSLGLWLLTAELALLGSGIVYLVKRPDLYNVPIVTGLAFGLLGLMCFLKADKSDHMVTGYLCAGTVFTALIAGCRPQLMLFAIFPVILFRKRLLSVSFYRSAEGKKAVAVVLIPLILMGGFLMYYNFIRFGSVFDFGANYNLTTNDMRQRGWVWGRIPLGLFVYFLQPMKFTTEFPFVDTIYTGSQYMGLTISEYTVGGVFAAHAFASFGILAIVLKKYLKKSFETPWVIAITCMAISLVVAIADTEMAGVLWRYQCDFSIFIMLAAVLTCWAISSHEKLCNSSLKDFLIYAVLFCFVAELLFQGGTIFLDTGSALKDTRPDLFSQIKYLVAFWL